MNESHRHHAEQKQLDTRDVIWVYLHRFKEQAKHKWQHYESEEWLPWGDGTDYEADEKAF